MSEYPGIRTQPALEDLDPTGTLFDPALQDTESGDAAPETSDEALERRLDEQADKLGNYVLARESLDIESDEPDDDTPPLKSERPARRRASRRGGRSYNEGSDSEHDPVWNESAGPLTPEQRLLNVDGIAQARVALEAAKPKPPHVPTADEIAAQRAADAAEIRRKTDESWAGLI